MLWLCPTQAIAEVSALVEFLSTLNTFEARFSQQVFDDDGELTDSSAGRCAIKKPRRFFWRYETPYAQLIVSNSEVLWIFDEDLEQATLGELDDGANGSPAYLLGSDINVEALYDITSVETSGAVEWFELAHKQASEDFQNVRLAFDGERVVGLALTDRLGQRTVVEFDEMRINQGLPDALFEFEPPPGVDVVRAMRPEP
ncbi:MAG: outer membrane lipoprotein chaperone LolA [Pseudomonadota bacterium]